MTGKKVTGGKTAKAEKEPEKKLTQKEVNLAAWDACDTFRGVMDASVYKDYILTMLFVKRISDVWKDRSEDYRKKFRGDKGRISRRLGREQFVLPEKDNFVSLYERRNDPNIGEIINTVLDSIEDKNKKKLEGVFRDIDFNSQKHLGDPKDRHRRLKLFLEDMNKLDLRPSRLAGDDIIGNTYIYLIERFASDAGKKAGEFYTPLKVSELVMKLCNPQAGARICDPACGSGGLLLQAPAVIGKSKDFSLYGMEVNGSTWALCRMNMFLHGADSAQIEWCNTITAPQLVEKDRLMKFDNIVANPPFSMDKWGAEEAENDRHNRFWRGTPPKSKGDYAFITHMIETARPQKGRVAVVVPHGVLFRGAAEGRIRQQFIDENLLDAVIGLPGNLFPTTGIPVAILVFDRAREKGGKNAKCRDVLFIDAGGEYKPGKNQNELLDEHIAKIVKTYRSRRAVKKYARRASIKEIAENDYNLNIPRYVDTFEEEAEIDIDAVQKEIIQLEGELAGVRKKMAKILNEIKR